MFKQRVRKGRKSKLTDPRLKDALSKTQREILQQLNLKLRNDAEVNLAMFKQRVRKGRKSKLTDPALFSSLTDVLTGTI